MAPFAEAFAEVLWLRFDPFGTSSLRFDHAMDCIWVPTHHEHKKGYFYSLMEAFFQWDRDDLEHVKERLIHCGWTDDDFFRRRVKRIALPPHKLYYRVRAVFVAFGDKKDSKTDKPLFTHWHGQKPGIC
jgi:hypothetical protein